MTTATITDRVRRGALLLDAEAPGWAGRINEEELDLGSCDDCILGQVYGEFDTGMTAILGTDPKSCERWNLAEDYGFTIGCLRGTWDDLAAAWLIEIRARLQPPVEPPVPAYAAWNCPVLPIYVP